MLYRCMDIMSSPPPHIHASLLCSRAAGGPDHHLPGGRGEGLGPGGASLGEPPGPRPDVRRRLPRLEPHQPAARPAGQGQGQNGEPGVDGTRLCVFIIIGYI